MGYYPSVQAHEQSIPLRFVLNYLPQRSQLVVSSDFIFLEASKTNKKKQSVI